MKTLIIHFRQLLWLAIFSGFALGEATAFAQAKDNIRIVALLGERTVEILPHGSTTWVLTQTNQTLNSFDRVRTGKSSAVVIRWSDQSVLRFDALTELEVLPPEAVQDDHGLNFVRGLLYFFHRGSPGRIRVITSGALAGIKGTEFVMSVLPVLGVEQTRLSVIDGQVSFENAAGNLELTNQQQAVAEPGRKPMPAPGFIANNILQWCFYYPGVLDLNDLPLATFGNNIFAESLVDYRAGDLLGALAKHPGVKPTSSAAEIIYHATVLLNGGQISAAEAELSKINFTQSSENTQRLANALRTLIAAVKHETFALAASPQLATEFLAASYYAQSQAGPKSLEHALQFARQTVEKSPEFGFGWKRVAELEFSFGRTEQAMTALDHALRISPRNAEALSLKGFLLAAQNKTPESIAQFDRALALDAALGNAWLGRGLCQIRRGDLQSGRENLLIAAAMEPQRATLRSYLGKAFGDASDPAHALHELNLAKQLDPGDPTAWLYSALLHEQNNRVNAAVRDLEKSQALNNNRGVYRSSLLLDQDRAVRSANLARTYAEAGLEDFALREAGESVAKSYANFGSHVFLQNAYQQNVSSGPFGRRFETPTFSEHLISVLLGPVDGSIISPNVSQQEYTRLFERDGAHISSATEYLSRGAWTLNNVQYGTFGATSYAVEADYLSDPSQAANAQLEFHSFSASIKQKLTPKDAVFLQIYESSWQGGDTSQHYDPANTSTAYHFKEEQLPNILLGYHHEWSADSHTLILASRFNDVASYFDPAGAAVIFRELPLVVFPPAVAVTDLTRSFDRTYTANTFELQQIQKAGAHTLVAGAKVQANDEKIANQDSALENNLSGGSFAGLFTDTPYSFPVQNVDVENFRASFYLSDFWQVNDHWLLFGGLDADYLRLARNTIAPPLSAANDLTHPVSPKAGLLWTPNKNVDFSLAYAQSVGGQDLDQSIRLEPANFAGLPLTFRTAFPDSLVSGPSGEHTGVWQAASRFHLGKDTYGVLGWQHLDTSLNREIGAYVRASLTAEPLPGSTRENLDFHEDSLQLSLQHLFGERLNAGVHYVVSHADLKQTYAIPSSIIFLDPSRRSSSYEGILHTLAFDAQANLPNGIFAGTTATWRLQNDLTDAALGGALPDERFWQVDLFAGYRSPHRHYELRVGLLNIADTNYRLDPINAYPELPRKQTLALSLRFNF